MYKDLCVCDLPLVGTLRSLFSLFTLFGVFCDDCTQSLLIYVFTAINFHCIKRLYGLKWN